MLRRRRKKHPVLQILYFSVEDYLSLQVYKKELIELHSNTQLRNNISLLSVSRAEFKGLVKEIVGKLIGQGPAGNDRLPIFFPKFQIYSGHTWHAQGVPGI